MQLVHRLGEAGLPWKHPRLLRRQVSLAQIARRTRGDHVFPSGVAAFAARDDVIEGEIVIGRAILADEAVAQEHVEPGEGGVCGWLDEGFQRHHARQLNLERGAAHRAVIVLDDVDAFEKHRLDRVLPRPERQRIITERPEVRIQHQYRPTALRHMCVQVTLLAPILAAKQHELTYYRQRDGIVKSIGRLYPPPTRSCRDCRVGPKTLNGSGGTFRPQSVATKMITTSRYLEAPRRLRAFVRAHETSLVALAALVGTIGGWVVVAMSIAVAGLHALLFSIDIRERLSSQLSIDPLRALLIPSLGGLVLGVAFLLLQRWRPAREIDPIEANALHGGRMSFRGSVMVALQTGWSSGVGASVGLGAGYTQLGSGIAASLGRAFHLRRADQRIMVGCGAAAAIAGAFGAPLAGAFYAFELVIGGYTPASLTPVGVAAVAGYFVAHAFGELSLGVGVGPVGTVLGHDLAIAALLGIVAALFGIGIMRGVALCETLLAKAGSWVALGPARGGLAV